jgi:hypothetical protein
MKTIYAAATSITADAQVIKESFHIRITGVFIDNFNKIAEPITFPQDNSRSTMTRWLFGWIRESDKLLNGLKSYQPGESLKQVQLRTIIGNRIQYMSLETGDGPIVNPSQALLDAHINNFDKMYSIRKDDSEVIDWSSLQGKDSVILFKPFPILHFLLRVTAFLSQNRISWGELQK